ncbi:hypothetical protein BTN50_1703 (plasmid) [Candidatus Enterovibrio altilux]|uniref:Uncharacterized protein n=1 Tax=Candidatus Enterovibrio altilux TaxID=1927128 RepID=A0A291BAT9_9GAMM|nr:hypothetical protein BTN50_1703 [Candidatus Enterovibrio luxaltus]
MEVKIIEKSLNVKSNTKNIFLNSIIFPLLNRAEIRKDNATILIYSPQMSHC